MAWQYFSGMRHTKCDPTQIGRFRALLGEEGGEELLKATLDAALAMKAVHPQEF